MQETLKPNYYEILQLQPYANPAVVMAAYRVLSKLYHPDTAREDADVEKFRLIQEAYDTLSDPQKRLDYDRELRTRIPSGSTFWQAEEHAENVWNGSADASTETYDPSPEEMEFYKNIYKYSATGGRRGRAIVLMLVYIVLMTAAITCGLVGVVMAFSDSGEDKGNAVFFFMAGIILLIIAQFEGYMSWS